VHWPGSCTKEWKQLSRARSKAVKDGFHASSWSDPLEGARRFPLLDHMIRALLFGLLKVYFGERHAAKNTRLFFL